MGSAMPRTGLSYGRGRLEVAGTGGQCSTEGMQSCHLSHPGEAVCGQSRGQTFTEEEHFD